MQESKILPVPSELTRDFTFETALEVLVDNYLGEKVFVNHLYNPDIDPETLKETRLRYLYFFRNSHFKELFAPSWIDNTGAEWGNREPIISLREAVFASLANFLQQATDQIEGDYIYFPDVEHDKLHEWSQTVTEIDDFLRPLFDWSDYQHLSHMI